MGDLGLVSDLFKVYSGLGYFRVPLRLYCLLKFDLSARNTEIYRKYVKDMVQKVILAPS